MSNSKSHTIYVVDDDPSVLKAICQTISANGKICVGFNGAYECVNAMRSHPCDLLITDVNMPQVDGVTLLRKVKEYFPQLAVLIITGFGNVPMAVEAIKAGASDFIEKPFDQSVLLAAVERAIAASPPKQIYDLTAAERRILHYLAQGKSNKEIAFVINRSIRTVENQRHRLMKKLKVSSSAQLIRIAISLGLTEKQISAP